MTRTLRGMTWDHTRGFDPMVATAAAYTRAHPDVRIDWDARSLQAFADHPVEQLAAEYDLIVIDHPHAGFVARHGCLLALDNVGRDESLRTLRRESVGGSHGSYEYGGHQWALAIDAATQVACYRPDLLHTPPVNWTEVLELAAAGRVLWPLKPVDALMSFFTVTANRGTPCRTDGSGQLIAFDAGTTALQSMIDLARLLPSDCMEMNPIQAYERLVDPANDRYVYCPLGYGYTNYSRDGFRQHLLHFCNIAEHVAGAGPRGTAIGGTGIAVSVLTRQLDVAVDYAFWIASAECQKGLYFDAGGQPANAAAWDDDRCNALTCNFFRSTRATLDRVYIRPRNDGYIEFQAHAGSVINACLQGGRSAEQALVELNRLYEESNA